MKLEKINDNQIRCTLDSGDLSDRQLNIRELTYGTAKARSLFQEMIQRASRELGFDAEDIPLMIETIPMEEDSIMLLITKMDDPEELDTRFAKFAPSDDDLDEEDSHSALSHLIDTAADSILHALTDNQSDDSLRIFRFSSLDTLIAAAHVVPTAYQGASCLYRDAAGHFFLTVHCAGQSAEIFNKICNLLSEYGSSVRGTLSTEAYYREHLETVIAEKALQVLAKL